MNNKHINIAIILGTRPEIIKMSPVIRECIHRDIELNIIHTGQHYSENLDTVFFENLELPMPDYNLHVGSKSSGKQTGEMIAGIEEILIEESPDCVLVQGDTNSVLAGAIAADKLDMKLGHVEAGLRSFDRGMPEESNRRITDHISDYLFSPTESSANLLRNEGIEENRISVTGNTVVDAVQQNLNLAKVKSDVLSRYDLVSNDYILLTAHRAENVDSKGRFQSLIEGSRLVAQEFDTKIIYPVHPRARQQSEQHGLEFPEEIVTIEPQDYLDFLTLEDNARLILTDSGGVQEEACILGVPCVTLRDNTERPETIDVGANVLAGVEPKRIEDSATSMLSQEYTWLNPFGDGTAGEQIIEISRGEIVETKI